MVLYSVTVHERKLSALEHTSDYMLADTVQSA
jgi:hypothetical protein